MGVRGTPIQVIVGVSGFMVDLLSNIDHREGGKR